MNKEKFDPRDFGFRCFELHNDTLHFFELDLGFDNTKPDLHRLNTYLTQDGDFVTIWWGFFDAGMVQFEMEGKVPEGFNFKEQYDTEMFRGFIENKAEAEIILKSIRFDERKAQSIFWDDENRLSCEVLKRK